MGQNDHPDTSGILQKLEQEDLFKKPVPVKVWRFIRDRDVSSRAIVLFLIFLFGIVGASWHIYTAVTGAVETFYIRPLHVFFIMGLGILIYDWTGNRREFDSLDWTFAVDLSLYVGLGVTTLYPILGPGDFQVRNAYGLYTQTDLIMAALLMLITAEMMRRVLGYLFFSVVIVIFVYTLYGDALPGMLAHGGVHMEEFLTYQYMTTGGIWGTPIGVMARYVVLFIIFGAFLDATKGGMLIQRFGNRLTGGSAGGPAKIAIVTSSLMGTISGSALANITTTGSFTIPLMKRLGYSPEDSAGIEAAASSGGQFTPPIMGAVAFIMMSIAQAAYLTIIAIAIVPALLYYVALFTSAHVAAKYNDLPTIPEEDLPSWREVIELSHMALPVVVLLTMLILGYSVIFAALAGVFSTWAVSMLRSSTRMDLETFLNSMYNAADTAVIATVACAGAGIIVGLVQLSGIGIRISSGIIGLASGSVLLGLFLVMCVTVMMGLGMPTVPAYAITVSIGLPALLEMGMEPLASHMFIVYFAVISLITPPVMVGSFAAASIADADAIATGVSSVKFALLAFVIPYVFILNPELLIVVVDTSYPMLIYYLIGAITGAVFIGMGTGGYALSKLHILSRLALIGAGIVLLDTGLMTDAVGLILGIIAITVDKRREIHDTPIESRSDHRSTDE